MGVTSKSVRLPVQRTKPLRGGKDPGLVHKPSASATRPIDSDFAPCLYQRAAPCYSLAWLRLAAASVRFFTSRSPGTLPRTRPLPIYSIYIKAKAVPVAASSSEIASARPTGPEFRPRSFTALRIQDSSEGATLDWGWPPTYGSGPFALATPCTHVPGRYSGPSNFKSRVAHPWSRDIGSSTSAAQTSLNMVLSRRKARPFGLSTKLGLQENGRRSPKGTARWPGPCSMG